MGKILHRNKRRKQIKQEKKKKKAKQRQKQNERSKLGLFAQASFPMSGRANKNTNEIEIDNDGDNNTGNEIPIARYESSLKHRKFVNRQKNFKISASQRIQELLKNNKKKKKKQSQSKRKEKIEKQLSFDKNSNDNKNNENNNNNNTNEKNNGNNKASMIKKKKNKNKNKNGLNKKKKGDAFNKLSKQLSGAQFRWMNELLYTQTGCKAFESAKEHENEFKLYHETYNAIVNDNWPQSPNSIMIKSIIKFIKKSTLKNGEFVIADMGCGDAKIAQYFDNKDKSKSFKHFNLKISVKSFDLIKINDYVTDACDMSNVPLKDACVDCCVFCLSLMGTNWIDYLIEANRILLSNGILKIIEVKSRFVNFHKFERCLFHCGFDFVSKSDSFVDNVKKKEKSNIDNQDSEANSHFILYNFKKSTIREPTSSVRNFGGSQNFTILKPCTYKKR